MPSFTIPKGAKVDLFSGGGGSFDPAVLRNLIKTGDFSGFSTDLDKALRSTSYGGQDINPLLYTSGGSGSPMLAGSYTARPGAAGYYINTLPGGSYGGFDPALFGSGAGAPVFGGPGDTRYNYEPQPSPP